MSIPKNRPLPNSRRSSHYFDPSPAVQSRPRTVFLHLRELALELQADRGGFGSRGIDLGTLSLLREAPGPPLSGEILDLGSGYGPSAIALAPPAPRPRARAGDVSGRAPEVTRGHGA